MFVIGRVEGLFNIYTSLGCAIGTMRGGKIGGTRRNVFSMKIPSICREMEKEEEGRERKGERMLRLTRRCICIYIEYTHT